MTTTRDKDKYQGTIMTAPIFLIKVRLLNLYINTYKIKEKGTYPY